MTTVPAAPPLGTNLARAIAVELACLAALAIACAWQLHDLERVLDLASWDEADYLRRGLAIPDRGLPQAEWGPLYAIWYFLLSRAQPDRIALFYLSYRSLVALPTFALFACARRLGVSPGIALLVGSLFLLSGAPHVMPRPTLLALLIVLLALGAAARIRGSDAAYAVMGLALLVAAFARPELFTSFLIVSAAVAAALLSRLRRGRGERGRSAGIATSYVAAALAMIAAFGNPLGRQDSRRLYAFCQHFAVGEVKRHGLAIEPWGQCEAVMRRAFGEVKSVGEAARRNPSTFLAHLADNLRQYPDESAAVILRGFGGARVDEGAWTSRRAGHLAAFALLLGWWVWAVARGSSWMAAAARSPRISRAGVVVAAVLVPSIASAILIQPRSHYLVLQGVLVPLFVVAWSSVGRGRAARRGPRLQASDVGAVALALSVTVAAPHLLQRSPTQSALPNLEVVRFLKSHAANIAPAPSFAQLGVLELDGGYDAYATSRFRRISPAERRPEESFRTFLERRGIRVVVLSPRLSAHHRMAGDPEFQAFTAAPAVFGFSTRAIEQTDRIVAMARDSGAAPGGRASVQAESPRPIRVQ
jgi:hypothetical protein